MLLCSEEVNGGVRHESGRANSQLPLYTSPSVHVYGLTIATLLPLPR